MPEVRYVDWGLANNFGDYIEVHRDLKSHPQLLYPILKHEHGHDDGTFWSDFKLDFIKGTKVPRWEMFKFMLKRPKTWIQFLPVYYAKEKGFVYDVNKILFFVFFYPILIFDMYFIIAIARAIL